MLSPMGSPILYSYMQNSLSLHADTATTTTATTTATIPSSSSSSYLDDSDSKNNTMDSDKVYNNLKTLFKTFRFLFCF